MTTWLEEQFAVGDELVIKDPRAAWFLGLWRAAAERCDATASYVTMLRPVTEVVGSKQKYYGQMGAGSDQGAVTRTAAWINMMLHTERATRGQQRAFVRYGDLLDDWTQPVFALGEAFDLNGVKTAMAVDIAEVHRFIDPSLRRVTMTWDDIGVPARLRELADETWQALDAIADDDSAEGQERCDQLRAAYAEQYAEAEAFAHSTVARPTSYGGGRGAPRGRVAVRGPVRRAGRRPGAPRRTGDGAAGGPAEAAQGHRPGASEDARHRLARGRARLRRHVAVDVRRTARRPGSPASSGCATRRATCRGCCRRSSPRSSTCCSSTTVPTTAPPTSPVAWPRSAARPTD